MPIANYQLSVGIFHLVTNLLQNYIQSPNAETVS